ncbi:MAG: soluble NSF attachment family protein [Oscillospiraceae bacterium]|nr:soluble NSF attachment family protein [Oscillospiraceae bacterium]
MKKKLTITLLLGLCLLLSGCADAAERAWQTGQKALAEEKYAEAAAAFEKAGSFQDSERLHQYAEAALAFENGDYEKAVSLFRNLGDFKDSSLMVPYCEARRMEAGGEAAFTAGDVSAGISRSGEASVLYAGLALFRDSSERAQTCREGLYSRASEYMNAERYEEAATVFAALGGWQESKELQTYCQACAMVQQTAYTEAAELFSGISGFRDSAERADAALEQAYLKALNLKETGAYRAASDAFTALGSYRDAESQRDSAALLMIDELLGEGSYAEVLTQLGLLEDSGLLHPEDPAAYASLCSFLDSFMNSWMNAHAGTLNAYFSCGLLEPYVEAGSELDTLIRASLTDETAPQNYGFVFYGSEIPAVLPVSDGYYAATVSGSASVYTPGGIQDYKEEMQVLLDTEGASPVVAAVNTLSRQGEGDV